MTASTTSPNVDNYYIGKGIVYVADAGTVSGDAATWRDVGNAPTFEFTPNLVTLDHFSSRSGVKSKDKSVIIEKNAKLRIVLEEMTPDNLAIALLGESFSGSSGTIDIFSKSEVLLAVKFEGRNAIGPRCDIIFPNVSFKPSKAFTPLSDEWGNMEIEGDVLIDLITEQFGTLTWSDGTSGA